MLCAEFVHSAFLLIFDYLVEIEIPLKIQENAYKGAVCMNLYEEIIWSCENLLL